MVVAGAAPSGGMAGRRRQHQPTRLRNARPSAPSMSHWRLPDSSQSRNSPSCARLRPSRLGAVVESAHPGHFHRCAPALVLPFFLIGPPHTGHRRALFDFVRMAPCNRRDRHSDGLFNDTSR